MDRNILKEALVGVNGKRDVDLLVSLSKQHCGTVHETPCISGWLSLVQEPCNIHPKMRISTRSPPAEVCR